MNVRGVGLPGFRRLVSRHSVRWPAGPPLGRLNKERSVTATTPAQENRSNGVMALVVAVLVAALVFALSFSQGWVIWLLILGEITAIALGIMAWHSGAGKLAVVLAVLLTVGLIVWVQSPKKSGAGNPPPAAAE